MVKNPVIMLMSGTENQPRLQTNVSLEFLDHTRKNLTIAAQSSNSTKKLSP
jgi:hypothetical protein